MEKLIKLTKAVGKGALYLNPQHIAAVEQTAAGETRVVATGREFIVQETVAALAEELDKALVAADR